MVSKLGTSLFGEWGVEPLWHCPRLRKFVTRAVTLEAVIGAGDQANYLIKLVEPIGIEPTTS